MYNISSQQQTNPILNKKQIYNKMIVGANQNTTTFHHRTVQKVSLSRLRATGVFAPFA